MNGESLRGTSFFYSIFKEDSLKFLAYKASCGTKYSAMEHQLIRFDRFCLAKNIKLHEITESLYTEWIAELCQGVSPSTKYSYIRFFNSFCEYLSAHGVNAYHRDYVHTTSMAKHYIPHIYTLDEIRRFKQASMDAIGIMPNNHLAKMFPMIFTLLYGCGLRIGEAVNITKDDIDFDAKAIRIVEGKGGISRLIPLSADIWNSLDSFIETFHPYGIDQFLFSTKRSKTPIHPASCYTHFRKVLTLAGIPHLGKGKGPRIHDFRHTFAVTSLRMFIGRGIKPRVAMVYLSRYLGHSSPKMTEYYIHLCPECIPAMQKHMDDIAEELFGGEA